MKIFQSSEFRAVVASIALASLMMACTTGGGTRNGEYFGVIRPHEGQVLRYYTGTESQTLDPHRMTLQPESRIAVALFDGLVEYEVGGISPVPSIATHWETNEGGTVWTFHLRQGVRWTDGEPLDAHDFVYSWRRALSPQLAAQYATQMYHVKNGQPYNSQMAFMRDRETGRYATTADLERAGTNTPVQFTGAEPEDYSAPPRSNQPNNAETSTPPTTAGAASYLFVPADGEERAKLLNGDPATSKPPRPELARFIEGKEIVPVRREHLGVRALDDHTFQVTLEAPTAFFLRMVTHQFFRPVPQQAIERHGDVLWVKPENIVTSGAFRLVQWTPYDRIVLDRNMMFWDNANTRLDRIIFPTAEEITTAMNLYKAGEIDAVQSNTVPPPWRNQMYATYRDYVTGPYLSIEFLIIKTTMPPLNDVRVRRALSMAINRQILADRSPGQRVLTGFTPPMPGYTPAEGTDYNPDEARRLLTEAGFPNGQGFPQIEIYYNTLESNKQLMELVQSMLKRELNIPVILTNAETRVWNANTKSSTMGYNGLARRGWVGDYVDPNTFFELMTSEADNNGTGWRDLSYDRMVMRANAETDEAERARLLREAESYMLAQQPVIPLVVKALAWMRKPYVRNMNANLLDQFNWRGVYIDHNWQESEAANQPAAQR